VGSVLASPITDGAAHLARYDMHLNRSALPTQWSFFVFGLLAMSAYQAIELAGKLRLLRRLDQFEHPEKITYSEFSSPASVGNY
jgi:hypothetical protein